MKSLSRPASIPDPTPFFLLITFALAWILLGTDGAARLWLLGVAFMPVAAWLFYRLTSTAEAGIMLLVGASAIPRGTIDIGGLNLRPEHAAVGLLCLSVPLLLRRRPSKAQWMFADSMLVAYVAANVLSSLFMSVAPSQTLKWCLQQTLAILPYFFLRLLADTESGFRWAFRAFLAVGALAAAYGVVSYYSNFLFGTEFGVDVEQYGTIPGTYGTQFEANILGAYCGACSVAMLAMYLQERRKIYLIGYGITLAGMSVSLSRMALAATFIGLLLLAYCARRMRLLNWRVVRATTVATLCVALVILPVVVPRYVERFSSIDVSDPNADDNTVFRLVQLAAALDGFIQSPVLGNGTASFQLLSDRSTFEIDIGSQVPWISNSELRILHDTGVVGFIAFMVFLVALAWQARRLLRRISNPALVALLVSAVVYCVSFQATEGTILAFTWVHLGLISCAISLMKTAAGDPATGMEAIVAQLPA
jgi:hypothetical protein